MKKLLFIFLMPFCTHAADIPKKTYSALEEYLEESVAENKFGGPINPSAFNKYGKKIVQGFIDKWCDVAQKNNISQGLSKIFFNMQKDGVDQVINDEASLTLANIYYADYNDSPSAKIEFIIKNHLNPGKHGAYSFRGAKQSNEQRIDITRQHEFYNIMRQRNEAPIMPEKDLVDFYNDKTKKTELELLKLNENNNALSPAAFRGMTLLTAYFCQQDGEDKE